MGTKQQSRLKYSHSLMSICLKTGALPVPSAATGDVSDEEGWEYVKKDLVAQVGGGSIPVLYVLDVRKDGSMALGHEHDGRDLDMKELKATLQHVKTLWEYDVNLDTIIDGKYMKF